MEKSKIRTLLFFFLFFFTTALSKHLCHQDDKTTLLKIKKSLKNPNSLSTWNPKTDCCSSWSGVTCSDTGNHRVTDLFIGDDDNISAHIPPELGDLTYLKKFVFQMLPNLTGEIPPTIAKLKNLEALWFISTGISGPVPEFLSQLKNLQIFDLSFNKLSGPIPSSYAMLPNLEALDFSDNKGLTGSIPDFISRKLSYLDLSNNQLTGTIPKSLGNIDFTHVDFSQNKLQGDASMLFGANKTTDFLKISKNMFHFKLSNVKIPNTITELDLSHNIITGHIPAQWTEAQATDLRVFNVSYNKLCGRIPTGGKLQSFDSYSYFHNKCLCGAPLPSCK